MTAGRVKNAKAGVTTPRVEMAPTDNPCQLHIHISGEDRPGILAEALERIESLGWDVLDIKQFVFHGLLNLSLLLSGKSEESIEPLRKLLQAYGEQAGVKVRGYPWDRDNRPEAPYKYRSVVTLLGGNIPASALLELTQTFAQKDINILRIEQLDYADYHVLELVIGTRREHSSLEVLNALVRFKELYQVDVAVQEDTLFRRNKRLIVLDADMTFLQCEVIDELGKLAGVGDQMAGITKLAVTGEMDFAAALCKRVKLLKGLPIESLETLYEKIPLTDGAEELVGILRHLGYKIAIISGGFLFFIDRLRKEYGLDYGFANQLQVVDGVLTGEIEGEIIDAAAKEKILASLAEREGFSLRQVVAVGDGANDIRMLARAGLGIAFNAKPIVQRHAHASINRSNLELILYFLGISGKELQELRQIAGKQPSPSWGAG